LHLLNSNHIRQKLEQSQWLQSVPIGYGLSPAAVTEVYLTILSRFPTADEIQTAIEYSKSGVARGREALVDVAWALVNSAEFAYQH
jgi:predicted transcriptional regulator